jgi:hypothetical protein
MTTLTFIRHAQSQNNATNISEVDTPLSQLGISQASKLHGNYDLVVISPLTRTLQTFRHSHIFAPRIIISDLVREWKLDLCDFKLDEMVRLKYGSKTYVTDFPIIPKLPFLLTMISYGILLNTKWIILKLILLILLIKMHVVMMIFISVKDSITLQLTTFWFKIFNL